MYLTLSQGIHDTIAPGTGVARTRGSRVHDQDRERECKRQCRHQCASHATDGSQVPRVDPQNGGVVEVLEAAWTMQPCRHGGEAMAREISIIQPAENVETSYLIGAPTGY